MPPNTRAPEPGSSAAQPIPVARRPVAVVTGAGVRVGRAIALELARAGHDLALCAHSNSARLDEVVAEAAALGAACTRHTADLAEAESVDALATELAAAHPVVDVLVHNAAIFDEVPFAGVSRAHWARMQRINLEAPMFLTQGLLPCLQRAPAGCIVAITDVAGSRPIRRHSAYCVSKAGLAMLVSALAIELAPLRVNGVAPGAVAFPDDYDPHKRARILARVPLAREGSVADIAQAVRFVVQAPYVTGQIIAVDGGRHAGL